MRTLQLEHLRDARQVAIRSVELLFLGCCRFILAKLFEPNLVVGIKDPDRSFE